MDRSALGLIETRGLVGAVEAADTAAKAAAVRLLGFERVGGGLVTLRLDGDVASVQTAVENGAEAARRVGELISSHVIPHPHEELVGLLNAAPQPLATGPNPVTVSVTDLEALPVTRLRQLARQTPGIKIKGRQISRANKQELIAALQQARQHNI